MADNSIEHRVELLEEIVSELKDNFDKVITIINRVQWTATGLAIYFVMDNAGVVHALKVVLKIAGG